MAQPSVHLGCSSFGWLCPGKEIRGILPPEALPPPDAAQFLLPPQPVLPKPVKQTQDRDFPSS